MQTSVKNLGNIKSRVFNRIEELQNNPKQQKIWTLKEEPFLMGGTTLPIATMIEPLEERTIRGFDFFSFTTPRSVMMIAEAQTGGIIATDFESLERAMEGVPTKVLHEQIDSQVTIANKAKMLTNEEFFKYYKL